MKLCAVRIGEKALGDQLPCEYCKGFSIRERLEHSFEKMFSSERQ